jgi:hypothetical protein
MEKGQVFFKLLRPGPRSCLQSALSQKRPQLRYGKTYSYLLVASVVELPCSDDVLAGEALLLELESDAEGVALLPLAEPVVSDVELEPVLEDELESPCDDPFVASSWRHLSFSAPVMASQRGELPYEELPVDAPFAESELEEPELEYCANAATGNASATASIAALTFMESPLG